MRLVMSGSGSPPFPESVVGWKGTLASAFTPDLLTAATGLKLESEVSIGAGTDFRRFILSIPTLGVSETRTHSGTGESTSLLSLLGLELYVRHTGTWRLKWTAIEWRVNGNLTWSGSGGQLDSSMALNPASIPLFGIPPILECGATMDSLIGSGCLPGGAGGKITANVAATASGGWRFHDGSSWVVLPLALDSGDAPGEDPPMASLSGTTTWNLQVDAFGTLTSSPVSQSQIFGNGWIMASPNLPRDVVRMTEDPLCLVSRAGFPRVRQVGDSSWWTNDCSFLPIGEGSEVEDGLVLPSHTEMLAAVKEAGNVIEEPLVSTLNAPCGRSGSELWNGTSSFGGRARSVSFGPYLDQSDDVLPLLNHPDWRAVWANTWLAPHWSFFLWFPPGESAGSLAWPALGSPEASPEDYWLQIRQHMIRHPALPSEDATNQRTSIILEPLTQNGLAGLIAGQYLGRASSWWGVPRFISQALPSYAEEAAELNQLEFWTFEDDLGSVTGSHAELAPGAGWAEIDLARWDSAPYRTSEGMKFITLPTPTNCSAYQWSLITTDGAKVNLAPGSQEFPWAGGKKGAGSWAQDFGAGLDEDIGVETHPSRMISSSLFANRDRVQSLGLLPGRCGVKLKLTVTPLDPGEPVTVGFPEMERSPWGEHRLVTERSSAFALLSQTGPGTRLGDLSWWNYSTDSFSNPPLIRGAKFAPTVLDWLCQRRVSLQGIHPEDGLDGETAELFVEGEEYVQRAHLARDPFTQALVTHVCLLQGEHQPVALLQNTYRSVPPLSHFPHKDRDGNFAETESYCAKTWSATQATHWCLAPTPNPDQKVEMKMEAGLDLLTEELPLEGWSIRGHQLPSAGLEEWDHTISFAGKNQARVNPYRGFFFVPWAKQDLKSTWCCALPWGHLHRTESLADPINHKRFTSSWITPEAESTIDPEGTLARAFIHPERGTLLAVWQKDSQVFLAESWDDGETLTKPMSLLTNATHPTLVVLPDGRTILIAVRPDEPDAEVGFLVGRWKESEGDAWSDEAVLQDEAGALRVQVSAFHAVWMPELSGRLALTAIPEGEEGPAFWWSADEGQTWTRGTE